MKVVHSHTESRTRNMLQSGATIHYLPKGHEHRKNLGLIPISKQFRGEKKPEFRITTYHVPNESPIPTTISINRKGIRHMRKRLDFNDRETYITYLVSSLIICGIPGASVSPSVTWDNTYFTRLFQRLNRI